MAPDPPESSGPGIANHLSPVRALLVLAGFLVAVGVLVAVGTRPSVSGDALASVTTTTTTVAGGHGPSTTTTTVPPSTVKVVVANATATHALAAHYSTTLSRYGWSMQTPTDVTGPHLATSAVYYAAGQQEPAAAIALELGLHPSAVLPLTTAVPVSASGDNVVVVIGSDLVAASGL